MMYWYVFFVKTGKEYKVVQYLKDRLDQNVFMPFVPLEERLFKTAGKVKRELKPLFPGYVFIETDLPSKEFIKRTSILIHTSLDIICLLRYSNTEVAMRESERQMLLSICNDERCIESSIGIIKGDRIYITDGPLKGKESIVCKINRHTRRAIIKLGFLGEERLVNVSLEIVKKIDVEK